MRGTAGLGEARKVASEMWLQEVGYRDIVLNRAGVRTVLGKQDSRFWRVKRRQFAYVFFFATAADIDTVD